LTDFKTQIMHGCSFHTGDRSVHSIHRPLQVMKCSLNPSSITSYIEIILTIGKGLHNFL